MNKAILYKKEDKNLRCLACSHRCLISNGKTGLCGVRKNKDNKLYLLTYGKIIAEHIDPIEKKPLYHFLKDTKTYSIAGAGCNFKCSWCQNFEISQNNDLIGEKRTAKQIVEEALKSNCKSVSYTYTEPTIWAEFVYNVSKLAKEKGLKNIWVTNGYFSKECLSFFTKEKLIDAMNIDLKSFKNETYEKYCKAKLFPVIESIKRVVKEKIHLEITTLIIPKINDSEKELENIAEFIFSLDNKGEIPWHISRFFPMYKMFDKSVTSLSILKKAEEIGKQKGLKYVYIGKV